MAALTSQEYLKGQAPGPDGKYITGQSVPLVVTITAPDIEIRNTSGTSVSIKVN